MDKIKTWLSNIGSYLILGLVAAVGLLAYFLQAKNRKINALKAQIDLVDTQKKADLIEVDIKRHLENKDLLQKEVDELNNSLALLEQKRQQIPPSNANATDQEIEDFWNKKP